MGLLDRFRRKKDEPSPDPERLRDLLFDAAARGEQGRVVELCRAHREAILRHIHDWKVVPEPVRGDPAAVQRWGHGLVSVAVTFERELGDPSILRLFQPPDEQNPLAQWDQKLAAAKGLMEAHRYAEAKDLLNDLLIDVRDLVAVGNISYHGLTHGHLGSCAFSMGDAAGAKSHFEHALALCQQQNDREGVAVYLGLLYDVHRYLGEASAAAAYARRAAKAVRARGQADDADRWDRRAAMAEAGEPLNRVVVSLDDRDYELDEVPGDLRSVTVRFGFVRNRPSLGLCKALTEEGGALGGRGEYYEALGAFRRAAKVDRFDPQPRYEEGLTLMYLERYAEAAEYFAATEQLAPGWYNCRGDRWLAEQLAAGEVPHAVFLLLRTEDSTPESAPYEQRLGLADEAVRHLPRFAPLHLFRGRTLEALGREPEAAGAYRTGLAADPEPDVRTRLCLSLHAVEPSGDEKKRLLEAAAALADSGNLMAASMARVILRALH